MSKRSGSQAPRLDDLPDVLHIADVAAVLRISVSSTYEYARRGQLPCTVIKCGRRLFVSKAALLRALVEGETGQPHEGRS